MSGMFAVPDITLKALVAGLAEQDIQRNAVSVWRLVRSEELRFKKKLFAVEQWIRVRTPI